MEYPSLFYRLTGRAGGAILGVWRDLPSVTVSWRAERRGGERPEAVQLAGCWVSVTVEDAWVEGPLRAGEPLRRVFVVASVKGHRYRIVLASDGREEVAAWTEADPAAETVH